MNELIIMEEFELYLMLPHLSGSMDSSSMYGPCFLFLSVAAFGGNFVIGWTCGIRGLSLAMESTVTRALGVRKAILWIKVSQDQHSELNVIVTRGNTFFVIMCRVRCALAHVRAIFSDHEYFAVEHTSSAVVN